MLVRWNPPTPQAMKINTNGSSLGDPCATGFGGIQRDDLGNWIMGFKGYCGFSSNMTRKLFGIFHGLRIAN